MLKNPKNEKDDNNLSSEREDVISLILSKVKSKILSVLLSAHFNDLTLDQLYNLLEELHEDEAVVEPNHDECLAKTNELLKKIKELEEQIKNHKCTCNSGYDCNCELCILAKDSDIYKETMKATLSATHSLELLLKAGYNKDKAEKLAMQIVTKILSKIR